MVTKNQSDTAVLIIALLIALRNKDYLFFLLVLFPLYMAKKKYDYVSYGGVILSNAKPR